MTETHEADAPTIGYRLTISHGSFGVPKPIKLDGDLPLSIGGEVNALVRLRVTGTAEREPLNEYDTHTITTDATITELIEIGGAMVNTKTPATRQKSGRAKAKHGSGPSVFLALCILAVVISAAGIIASCSADPQTRQDQCRATAREVFTAMAADKMTIKQGQAKIDTACAGIPATERAAILDAERTTALANL